jgi:hypothetical protein
MDNTKFFIDFFTNPDKTRRHSKMPAPSPDYRLSASSGIANSYRLPIVRVNNTNPLNPIAYIVDDYPSRTTRKHLSIARYRARMEGYRVFSVSDIFDTTNALVSLTKKAELAAKDMLNRRRRITNRLYFLSQYKAAQANAIDFAVLHKLPLPAIPDPYELLSPVDQALFALNTPTPNQGA